MNSLSHQTPLSSRAGEAHLKAKSPMAGAQQSPFRLLLASPLFSCLKHEDLEALVERGRQYSMRRGEILIRQGDPGSCAFVLLAGEVAIGLENATGRAQILQILKPGDVFGETSLMDGQPRSANATALTNGRLLLLERGYVLSHIKSNPEFASRLIEILCSRLRATSRRVEMLRFKDVSARLAAGLLSMADSSIKRHIDITQSALGELAGASRETVNRKLREWEIAGYIKLTPGRVVLCRPEALKLILTESQGQEAMDEGSALPCTKRRGAICDPLPGVRLASRIVG